MSFAAGAFGAWRIERITPVIGEGLATAPRLQVVEGGNSPNEPPPVWALRGTTSNTSNTRYTVRAEVNQLVARQEGLGRTSATRAALIPIRKTEARWAMAQDERRAIFEEQSQHRLRYLPGIARRLHHSREFGEEFDFLTWFEYATQDELAFEELVQSLRATPEWKFVDREVDIRLSLVPA